MLLYHLWFYRNFKLKYTPSYIKRIALVTTPGGYQSLIIKNKQAGIPQLILKSIN